MADNANFRSWFEEKLSDSIGFPAGEDLVNYILTYEDARDIKEHLSSLLDVKDAKTKAFIDEFFKRWSPPSTTNQNAEIYKKPEIKIPVVKKKTKSPKRNVPNLTGELELDDNGLKKAPASMLVDTRGADLGKNQSMADYMGELELDDNGCKRNLATMVVDTRGAEFLDKNQLMPHEMGKKYGSPFKQKHLKFVPLYSADGKVKSDIVRLPGRHACQCLAQKHPLINNCVECGRIVCVQEGAGPCMFCGNLVCTPEDMEMINRESKKGNKLKEKLLSQVAPDYEEDPLQKAIKHKDRLLDFDKNCTKRTKVLDDEADYFSADNRWLNQKQKDKLAKRDAELREKRFTSRLDKKFTLDFAGRRVVEDEEQNNMYDHEDEVVQEVMYGKNKENIPHFDNSVNSMVDPRLRIPAPQFTCDDGMDVTESLKAQFKSVKECSSRLQDKGIQEMGDKGICLSMHQPWASLLVYGIKKLEGRSWYTSHRGRLWIASTVKVPEKELIPQLEDRYRYMLRDRNIEFPKTYPTGVLLGCVNLVDCAANAEYFEQHPDVQEENESQYLFVCENPEQLSLKLPVRGKHKTYKLENDVHTAAKNMLVMS